MVKKVKSMLMRKSKIMALSVSKGHCQEYKKNCVLFRHTYVSNREQCVLELSHVGHGLYKVKLH